VRVLAKEADPRIYCVNEWQTCQARLSVMTAVRLNVLVGSSKLKRRFSD
jgi:hypothetical protein